MKKAFVGMQLFEKCKEKLDVLSEGHLSPSTNSVPTKGLRLKR
jgi:hypothetical protein